MLALAAAVLLAQTPIAPIAKDLVTTAEKSGWKKTGRYDEVVRLCADFALAFPGRVRCVTFGGTPEGRPMVALVASEDGVLSADDARAKGRPVVLVQGGIHAGEIDGKDAGFAVLRELLEKKRKKGDPSPLAKVTFVFVPVFNVDGHERFGANHRPNQNGPEEMGWRVTSQNLNLNRDYAKAEAPEMGAMLRFLSEWDPIVYVDLHVTDGSDFRHQIAYLVEPIFSGPEPLRAAARTLREHVGKRLTEGKHLPLLEFYPSFDGDDDPSSGVSAYVAPPRFSTAYWALRNRIGVLVETHSWKDYATRVKATRTAVHATLEAAARHGDRWTAAAKKADEESSALAGKTVPLVFEATAKSRVFEMRGFAYERTDSEISGAKRIVYDASKAETWKVPFRDEVAPVVSVTAPAGGYVVPAAHAGWVREKLETHGIRWTALRQTRPGVEVETFRATKTTFGTAPYEGRQTLQVEGAWAPERRDLPSGSLFVPIDQPKARLVVHLLEPAGPDSFLAWGWFNAHFERKEYMEAYVAETVAREMLKDPAVKAEFEKWIADPEVAKDPRRRLDFFYRRHPSFDERFNLYPVMRVHSAP